MLIVMSGLPGTGKSDLSSLIAKQLRIPVFSVDPIESAILRSGIRQSFETGLAAYLVVEALADAQLKLGLDVIVDAVNAEEEAKETWRNLALKHELAPRIIECHCSDEALHRARLSKRVRGLELLPEPTWESVQKRRLVYTKWPEPVLSIDSVQSLESNARRALEWLAVA